MNKKIIIYSIISILFVAGLIVILLYDFKETIKITTEEKAYSYLSSYQNEENINVLLYIDSEDTYFTNKENIVNSYLLDEDTGDLLPLKINAIEKLEETQEIISDKYYRYVFHFNIDFKTDSSYYFESKNTNLLINYMQEENVKIKIGSISFYIVPEFNSEDLVISTLKGIVNKIDGKRTLVGIELGFRNNTNYDINITKIMPLDINVSASYDEIKKVERREYQSNVSMSSLLGYDYNPIVNNTEKNNLDLLISKGENNNYLIPLKKTGNYSVSKIGLSIEYIINNKKYNLYFDDFVFFTSTEVLDDTKLNIYYYENN